MSNESRWKRLIGLLVVLVLTGNVVFLVWRRQKAARKPYVPLEARERAQTVEHKDARSALIDRWRTTGEFRFDSEGNLAAVLVEADSTGCLGVPETGVVVSDEDVADDVGRLLWETVAGLLQCYADDSPEMLVDFMKAHREVPEAETIPRLRRFVAELKGVSESELETVPVPQLFAEFWHSREGRSDWESVLQDEGCRVFWRVDQEPQEALAFEFVSEETDVFRNIRGYRHCFESVTPIEDVLEQTGPVLVADVRVIMRLNGQHGHTAHPYLIRFWFEPSANVWHPAQLKSVATDRQAATVLPLF